MSIFSEEFSKSKIIVVCRGIDESEIVNASQAMYDGGIRYMEIPFIQSEPETFIETARKIKTVKDAFGDKMHVGAGTVITSEQFELAREYGAELIVSPVMDPDIILATKKSGLVSIPGCCSPSEMVKAYTLGADLIKLFPSNVLNLKTIKEIRLPLSHLPLVPFGGVNKDNIKEVIALGVAGVGMQSAILNKENLKNRDYAKITECAREITSQIR